MSVDKLLGSICFSFLTNKMSYSGGPMRFFLQITMTNVYSTDKDSVSVSYYHCIQNPITVFDI